MKIIELLRNPIIQSILIETCKALLEVLQNGKLPKDKANFLIKQIQELS